MKSHYSDIKTKDKIETDHIILKKKKVVFLYVNSFVRLNY